MSINNTMKALRKPYGSEGLIFDENAPIPTPGPEDILIKVITASVCGTDLHIYKSDPSIRDRVPDSLIIGHEFYGEVIEVGDQVHTLSIGDLVASESHIVCDTCFQCLNGQPHLCQEISLVGVDRPGGMAQYAAIPADNAVKISPAIPPEIACFMDAYGNAVDTCLTVPLTAKTVLITGCGPQGLMAIAIALASGAKQVIATEISPRRMMMAREIFRLHGSEPTYPGILNNPTNSIFNSDPGYTNCRDRLSYLDNPKHPSYPGKPNSLRRDIILDANDRNMLSRVYEATDGLGVDVFLEMAGHPNAIASGFAALRTGGEAVILGLAADNIEIDWNGLVFKAVTVHFRYGRKLYETWTYGQRLLESGDVKLDSLVHRPFFALDDIDKVAEAYNLQINGAVAKVIFTPNLEKSD